MITVIAGASGLIGTALVQALQQAGHHVRCLVRGQQGQKEGRFHWDPYRGELDQRALEGADAVINLSGENIASGRWTAQRKQAIVDSRVMTTHLLATKIASMEHPPHVFINASAIGFYGSRGDQQLTENSSAGTGFLSDACKKWEGALSPLSGSQATRVVVLRIGVVLSEKGGAFPKMAMPFKFFAGGTIGDGSQYISWIMLDDLVEVVKHCLSDAALHGPVNGVAPAAVTNREFTKALAAALHRPAILPLPAFVVRLLMGEMGEELLLSSTRVVPTKLLKSGFSYDYPTAEDALKKLVQG